MNRLRRNLRTGVQEATFRLILALAAQYGWDVDHMDVLTAFLNPRIDRDNIYMKMTLGIDWLASNESGSSGSVLILRKALYGLKQVPRHWYKNIDGYLQSIGFRQSVEDPNLYLQQGVLLVLYVDDLLITHNSAEGWGHQIKQLLQNKYKMCDLGAAKRFLGIEIKRTKDGVFSICQRGYINTIIRRFGLMDTKPAKSPLDPPTDLANTHCEDKLANRKEYLSMVGSLMYAALGSRPDIAFSVTALSRYNVQPLEMHAMAAKRVLRYLKTTAGFRIQKYFNIFNIVNRKTPRRGYLSKKTNGSRILPLLSDTPIPTGQGISQLGNPLADAYSDSGMSMSTTNLSYLG